MNIAFDIDDTLYKVIVDEEKNGIATKFHQVPDYELINLVHWHLRNGDTVFIWSAGGYSYASNWVRKFLDVSLGELRIINKEVIKYKHKDEFYIDICYDDQEVNLAKVNIRVKREERKME